MMQPDECVLNAHARVRDCVRECENVHLREYGFLLVSSLFAKPLEHVPSLLHASMGQ